MTNTETNTPISKPKMSLAKRVVIGGLVAISLAGIGTTIAVSKEMGMGHKGHMGMHGHGDRQEFMEFRFNKMMGVIKATPEQTEKLKAIFEKVKADMHPQDGSGGPRQMHKQVIELLGAPTIDKAAIEALRTEQLAKMEQKSKSITEALLAAADILTPEQRATLVEEMKKRGPRN